MPSSVKPRFFKTRATFRRWLEQNHASAKELWVGFYRKASGKGGVTYVEALEEALCFGWIDGVRRRLDEVSFVQRFSPRQAKSYWSAVNTKRAQELQVAGLMHEAGLAAFGRRDGAGRRYSFEQPDAQLDALAEKRFRTNRQAWTFFERQAPWYRRVAIHWVTSAKREETRQRRLGTLIADSEAGKRIGVVPSKGPDAGRQT